MREESFFHTTRGRIVQSLARHRTRTAAQLSQEHGVSANAVRQHLSRLLADGLVSEQAQRLGRTKPTLVYSLTPQGERLLPQRYPSLLNALLDQLRRLDGGRTLRRLFAEMGRSSARRHAGRFEGKKLPDAVAELAAFLRERGVMVECEPTPNGYRLREYNCPFRESVTANPEICSVLHTLMREVVPATARQTLSIAKGDPRCEFELTAGGAVTGKAWPRSASARR